ncbi:hypothetical protein E4U42_006993 [Claviceps africana]|uniref:Uncharacterized protein n=1 Tax=Claviceps africana TaxID=83212 RepID=A0A8K0NFE7_9HYPO|nr:hypothetical protein E4U42_006993 [Claviceps africana]
MLDMRAILRLFLRKPRWRRDITITSTSAATTGAESVRPGGELPSASAYPVFPPPPPGFIIRSRSQYLDSIVARRFGAPQGYFEDSPLFALYRLYEFIVLDRHLDYRNALEYFWRRHIWKLEDIPDPQDDDPERYAFLAGCTCLLARSFNQRVELGLRRENPPLITPEEAETARNVPSHLRPWERVPKWAEKVAPLKDTLFLPTHEGETIKDQHDPRADPDFKAKNILLWTPHIFFT